MRQAIDRALADPGLPAGHWRVFAVILADLPSWSRLSEATTRAQLANRAGVSEETVKRAMARLSGLGVVVWNPSQTRGKPSHVSLPAAVLATDHGSPGDPPTGQTTGHLDDPPYEEKYLREEEEGTRDAIADDEPLTPEEMADAAAWAITRQSVERLGCTPERWGSEPPEVRADFEEAVRQALLGGADPDVLFDALTSAKAPQPVYCWPALMLGRLRKVLQPVQRRRSA
ncbi:MAG: hypothetical protein ACYDDU_07325 [Dermatophilaceae bacterium]